MSLPADYHDDVALVTTLLADLSSDTALVRRIAWAVAMESRAAGIDPRLTVGIVRIENPWLIPDTMSYAGAVGLMQVIPRFWLDVYKDECGADLTAIVTNICFGTRIAAYYIEREERAALERALLRYSGCVKTPGCELYASRVLDFFEEEQRR